MKRKRLCILGTGNMGDALLSGILSAGLYKKGDIVVSDISEDRLAGARSKFGIETTKDNIDACTSSGFIIIAVKPGAVKSLLEEISGAIDKSNVIVSIAAGVSIIRIREWLDKDVPIIRVMPNTPVVVKEGITAISPGPGVKDADLSVIKKVFGAVGKTIVINEEHLNAVTGLSGSGPAYIFTIIEALSDGGVKAGLPRSTATLLAAQTVLGAAKMVLETGEHTGSLRDKVTSPGGTTIEGLYMLESAGIRAALISAVEHATKRAIEIEKGE